MKPIAENYIIVHREFYITAPEFWRTDNLDMYKILVYESYAYHDPNRVLIRISIQKDDSEIMNRDVLVNYNMKDYFLGDIVQEVNNFPVPLTEEWLTNRGFNYNDSGRDC